MTEEELLELCRKPKNRRRLFWTSEVYGFGKWLRKFAYFPSFLPLNIYFQHGVSLSNVPAHHELENKALYMFYFTPRLTQAFKAVSSKGCNTIVCPNVFYRRSKNILQNNDSKGTLAFPTHSTVHIDILTNYEDYIVRLKSLPPKFQPVSVCLHFNDVNKGLHKVFLDHEIEVLTVGHRLNLDFIERFYNIIKRFRYTTSNAIGTPAFYSVEMGIPFFLYGDEPSLFNNGDSGWPKGEFRHDTIPLTKARSIFSDQVDVVTRTQKKFVEEELGVGSSISRRQASHLFYKALFKYLKKVLNRKIFESSKSRE